MQRPPHTPLLPRPRVLVADDHVALHTALQETLEPAFEVVAAVRNGSELVAAALTLVPDIVITDITMPVLDGFEATRRILRGAAEVRVIFLTVHPDAEMAARALALGARGYVTKASAGRELPEAIDLVLAGGTYVSPRLR